MRKSTRHLSLFLVMALAVLLRPSATQAMDQVSTIAALRLAATITGGSMPVSDPIFAQMVVKIQAGDVKGAAMLAAKSSYFANYMAKRLAFQMQSPALDATVTRDNDSTAFLIAHFVGGGGVAPSISTILSDNQTYLVNTTPGATTPTPTRVYKVPSPGQIDWSSQIVTGGPQQLVNANVTTVFPVSNIVYSDIPAKHVGGYITASTTIASGLDAPGDFDSSIANYGFLDGTNLRLIEAIWEISTGLSLANFEDTSFATTNLTQAEAVPRFVPENNPSFFMGQGQAACISCHGGGLSAMKHGYATVADIFDYSAIGLEFKDPSLNTTAGLKSLGSTAANRAAVLACNLSKTPNLACNADSPGVDPNQAWDLTSWQQNGMLNTMGWTGPITGEGLNSLGVAIGQASITYEFMTKRVIKEICPVGSFTAAEVLNIANAANPFAITPGTDDIATIVALVASDPTCL